MTNWINTLENLLISLITGTLVFIGVTWSNQKTIDKLTEELANKVTYAIDNNFEKVKNKKGELILDINNTLTANEKNTINNTVPERRRIFNRNK